MEANKSVRAAKYLSALALFITSYGFWPAIETLVGQESRRSFSPRVDQLGIEFVHIPGGSFQMGDLWADGRERDRPVHTVTISDFEMSKHEITNGQFCAFMNDVGNQKEGGGPWLGLGRQTRESLCLRQEILINRMF